MNIVKWAASAAVLSLVLAPGADAKPAHPAPQLTLAAPDTVGFAPDRVRALDAAMDAAVDRGEVAGIETMLVRHGKIVDLHLHGVTNSAGAPIARDTIFRMYSQTKPMVGVAMMILFEQGRWRLEDPVTKFIPEFANLKVVASVGADGKPVLEDMKRPPTMRELMTHTAGFGYGLRTGNPVDDAFRDQKVLASNGLKDMIDKIAKIPLLYQPGTKWSYSAAVDIQGYIIEKLSGQRLGDFMAEHIFKPLHMADTGFFVPPAKAARLSGIYVQNPANGKLLELTTALFPALQDFTKPPPMDSGGGGSVSTVDDYARFCQMILNGGTYDGARILSPATLALMQANHLADGVTSDPTSAGGLVIGSNGLGFGLDVAVVTDPAKLGVLQGKGSFWWGGAAGTWFWIDPKNDLFFLGMIQRFGGGAAGSAQLSVDSQTFVYSALIDPER
ncbi:MAG TPA: serine hydrolase domain-containing protein [Rhizomicrobium sp.]|jgi:CubicO group peptidase (beta-lactamase class C family)|nr:serine hydrolase domain-containing protein [Rhizomicrobium sp.]